MHSLCRRHTVPIETLCAHAYISTIRNNAMSVAMTTIKTNHVTSEPHPTDRPPNFSLLLTIAFAAILMVAAISAFQLLEAVIG